MVLDDSEIKIGDHFYDNDGEMCKYDKLYVVDPNNFNDNQKIIAHLPLNGSPILEGVPLLPPIEEDVEKLGMVRLYEKYPYHPPAFTGYCIDMFKEGHKKAREKYRYTEEDMRKAIEMAYMFGQVGHFIGEGEKCTQEIIQSLHQYPTEFECEMEDYCGSPLTTDRCPKCIDSCDRAYQRPKTITTAQGVQWVGKYK